MEHPLYRRRSKYSEKGLKAKTARPRRFARGTLVREDGRKRTKKTQS